MSAEIGIKLIILFRIKTINVLHFFRNIRKSLVSQGKFTKYLTYALGEIVLVMFGILLALQVNNWNERRKSDEVMEKRAQALLKDLEYNIKESNIIIDFANRYDSIVNHVIANPTDSVLLNSVNTLLATQTAQFFKESLATFLAAEEQLPPKYGVLIPELKALNRLFKSQEKWEAITLEDREDITRNVMFTNDYNLTTSNESILLDELKRLASSNLFRNRVLFSYGSTFLEENAWDVTQIRASSIILLWKLKALLDGQNTHEINDFLETNGLEAFMSYTCAENIIVRESEESSTSYRMSFLFYNATQEKRFIQFLDSSRQVYETEEIAPFSFHFNDYELHVNDLFAISDGKNCLGQFKAVPNGFLAIEN